jgi:hypothetical protein
MEPKELILSVIRDSAVDLIEGAAEDIELYLSAIAEDAAQIISLDPKWHEPMLVELKNQIALVAELNRVRVSVEGSRVLTNVLTALVKIVTLIGVTALRGLAK